MKLCKICGGDVAKHDVMPNPYAPAIGPTGGRHRIPRKQRVCALVPTDHGTLMRPDLAKVSA